MIEFIKKSRIILCRLLELVLILAVLVLVLDVFWGVFTRWSGDFVKWMSDNGREVWTFLPRGQAKWSEELARYMLIWVSLLGGAAAFGEKAHLGVDYFVGLFDSAAQKVLAVFTQLVILVFAVLIFLVGGTSVAINNMQQSTQALGELKMGHVYLALPLAGIFIVIFSAEQMIELFLTKDRGGLK